MYYPQLGGAINNACQLDRLLRIPPSNQSGFVGNAVCSSPGLHATKDFPCLASGRTTAGKIAGLPGVPVRYVEESSLKLWIFDQFRRRRGAMDEPQASKFVLMHPVQNIQDGRTGEDSELWLYIRPVMTDDDSR